MSDGRQGMKKHSRKNRILKTITRVAAVLAVTSALFIDSEDELVYRLSTGTLFISLAWLCLFVMANRERFEHME